MRHSDVATVSAEADDFMVYEVGGFKFPENMKPKEEQRDPPGAISSHEKG